MSDGSSDLEEENPTVFFDGDFPFFKSLPE